MRVLKENITDKSAYNIRGQL